MRGGVQPGELQAETEGGQRPCGARVLEGSRRLKGERDTGEEPWGAGWAQERRQLEIFSEF